MTLEMQTTLEREMNDALKIEDAARRQDAILTVLVHQSAALVDCQRKTAARVKELMAESEARKNKLAGAKLLAGIIKAAVAVAGPTAAIYICKAVGILW